MITAKLENPRGMFNPYKDVNDEFRWNITSVNGNTIAASSEGFSSERNCEENARLTLLALQNYFSQPKPLLRKGITLPATKNFNLFDRILTHSKNT